MHVLRTLQSACRSLADIVAELTNKKSLLSAIAAGAMLGGAAHAAPFLDDFSADTSAIYFEENSYRSGGTFEISDGTLNITTGANNTFTVTTSSAVPFAVGESLGVDVPAQEGANGLFLTLGTAAGQPGGNDIGYRWRRDAGGGGLRPASDDDGIFADVADPDKSSPATLWIDRVAPDLFNFQIQLDGQFTRTLVGQDTYSALASVSDLHIGMQAFDTSVTTYAFDNLRIVDTSTLDTPPSMTLEVNTVSGETRLVNNSGISLEIDYYLVESAGGALAPTAWNSLSDQGFDSEVEADYNDDGVVDAADYTVFRDNFGTAFQLENEVATPGQVTVEDYQAWRDRFGEGVGESWDEAGGATTSQLAELFVGGSSTFNDGDFAGLGAAFNPAVFGPGVDGDLELLISLPNGQTFDGEVVYVTDGGAQSKATSTPEPSTLALVVFGALGGLRATARRRVRRASTLDSGGAKIWQPVLVAALIVCTASAAGAQRIDREYLFGDPGSADDTFASVGEGNAMGFPFGGFDVTGDETGPSMGGFIDLEVTGATYTSTAARPGGSVGDFGARFDGDDFLLTDFRLGLPSTSRSALGYVDPGTQTPTPGPFNYNGLRDRGMQFWTRPNSASQGNGTAQSLVADTLQHGVGISAGDTWVMQYGGNEFDSGVPVVFNDWSHVVMVSGPTQGARLYVDGVVVAAANGDYDGSDDTPLVVGANTGDTPGAADFFGGVIDDLQMFVLGDNSANAGPPAGEDYGSFDYATDVPTALASLTGVDGDVNQDGSLTPADIDAFVAGWLSENRVTGTLAGDLTTITDGDLNFDGITDLDDAFLLHEALVANGQSGLTQFGFGVVPEPATACLAIALVGAGLTGQRNRA